MTTTPAKQQTPSLRGWLGDHRLELIAIATWVSFLLALLYFCVLPSFSGCQRKENCPDSFGIEQAGQVGDSFGTLNALFTALAAVAAFKAYRSQLQQIREQQKEFASQRHESHLFFLMEELRQAVRGVAVVNFRPSAKDPTREELVGPVAVCHLENLLLGTIDTESGKMFLFREYPTSVRNLSFIAEARFALFDSNAEGEIRLAEKSGPYAMQKKVLPPIPSFATRNLVLRLNRELIAKQFNRFYEECAGAPLGNVFRLQAAILRYIDTPSIPEIQRKQHAELFKAQITDPELHLLLYYALSDLAGGDELRRIMVEYKILESLDRKKPEFIWHRIPEISYFEDTKTSPG